ncbi:hypothetical protein ILYODFUR_037487 [Ilyodon furcidens]|uniref:Uncharacterized protein n=1 Tax=Ilyodon furcidens TaxID=33524 RepID=A0ABV0T3G5_9TELE
MANPEAKCCSALSGPNLDVWDCPDVSVLFRCYSSILTQNSSPTTPPPVMFVCCSPDVFRKLMIHFWQAILPHSEYVFFFIDLFADSLNSRGQQPWERGDEDDAIAKEAFQVRAAFHQSAERLCIT